MWWIGCTGIWLKTETGTNIATDVWFGNGKRSQKTKEMAPFHQMRNMTGGRATQPNLRAAPIVYDPFAVTQVDAVLATHIHQDHIDPYFAAAVLKNCAPDVPFIGPQGCADIWTKWGVPAKRIKVVRPGDTVTIKDVEIVVLESFDRTVLVTSNEPLQGKVPAMDDRAVNYLFKTPGGNLYHSGDSHYSIRFAKHGKEHEIDVALGSYGENPVGNQDKMTSVDILRMAEALGTKVSSRSTTTCGPTSRPTRSRSSCSGTTRRTLCKYALFREKAECAPGGDQFHAQLHQPPGERFQVRLVRDGDERAADLHGFPRFDHQLMRDGLLSSTRTRRDPGSGGVTIPKAMSSITRGSTRCSKAWMRAARRAGVSSSWMGRGS